MPARPLGDSAVMRLGLALAILLLVATESVAAVSGLRARPASFSPNGDGVRDSTTLLWDDDTAAACLELRITTTADTAAVRRFRLGAGPVGRDSIAWDGRNDQGTIVADGAYYGRLFEYDATCVTAVGSAQVAITVDNTDPPTPFFDFGDTLVTFPAFAVAGTAADADTVALLLGGVRVDTMATFGQPGELKKFAFPVTLVEGDNLYSVQGWDRAGNLSPQTIAVDVFYQNTPEIGLVTVKPGAFSPNGDGVNDTTRVTFGLDAPSPRLFVQVKYGTPPATGGFDTSLPVMTLYDGPAAAGTQTFTWDGRDSSGAIGLNGDYVFYLYSDSVTQVGSGTPSARRTFAKFKLDTQPPATPIVEPIPARTIRDAARVTIKIVLVDSLRIFRDGVLLRTDEIDPSPIALTPVVFEVPLHLGANTLAFQGLDVAGNATPVVGPFTITYETPVGFHAPERFRRDDAFGVNLPSPASLVVVDLYTLRGAPVRELVVSGSATHYELQWDLKDAAGIEVGDGPYLARLRISYPDGTGTEAKAAIVVVK